jgi:hypothetical protein
MFWYRSRRQPWVMTLVMVGASLGVNAIAATQLLSEPVAPEPIERIPLEPIPLDPSEALPLEPIECIQLPIPLEPILLDPILLDPIEALPLEPIEFRPLEPIPLGFIDTSITPYYHIVLIDLLDTTTEAEIAELITDTQTSIASIPGVLAVDIGPKIRDDRDVHIRDYDLAVYVKFDSATALDAYGPHPTHQAFLERHRHLWSGIRIIDFVGSPPLGG